MPSFLLHFACKSFKGFLVDIKVPNYFYSKLRHFMSVRFALGDAASFPFFPKKKTKIHDNVINEPIFHSFGPHKVIKWQIKPGERRLNRPLLALLEIIIIESRHYKKNINCSIFRAFVLSAATRRWLGIAERIWLMLRCCYIGRMRREIHLVVYLSAKLNYL